MILYAASEAVPFCKTGGLADVAGSLPAALAAQGADVAVVLPLYQKVKEKFSDQLHFECYDYVDLAWRHSYCGLFSMERDGVTWYFLDNEQYFRRPELYGYMDDGERFGFFSRAVVRMLPHLRFWPEVIHCNDWQTALVPIYLKDDSVREERFRSIRTVLSIHNIEYQGRYGRQTLGDLFGLDHGWADDGTILMDGDVNLLKGAILCADAINAQYGPGTASAVTTDSYYNMKEKILPHMDLIHRAEDAFRKNDVTPLCVPIRGGTDGARLSWDGLPCPNLSTGGYNFHGVREWIPAASLDAMAAVLADLVSGFAQ